MEDYWWGGRLWCAGEGEVQVNSLGGELFHSGKGALSMILVIPVLDFNLTSLMTTMFPPFSFQVHVM